MTRTRTKCMNDLRAFEGLDVNKEISLKEYGILWERTKNRKIEEYHIWYGLCYDTTESGDFTRFTSTFFNSDDYYGLPWVNFDSIAKYTGKDREEYRKFTMYNVYDLVPYYGTLEIFGDCYHKGIKIV